MLSASLNKTFLSLSQNLLVQDFYCFLHIVLVPMEKIIQQTAEYTAQRQAFGKPLLSNQVIHFRLAELATEVELLRSLLYRAVGEKVEVFITAN